MRQEPSESHSLANRSSAVAKVSCFEINRHNLTTKLTIQKDSRTRNRPLRHLYHDWSIRLLCPPKLSFMVGKTSVLTNHDNGDVMVCHMFYSLIIHTLNLREVADKWLPT